MNLPLPEPAQLFRRFDSDCTSDGAARDRFEQFILDLVNARWAGATTVAARNHNDWGIDGFVGNLGGGSIRVWQSKYYREWQDSSHRRDVKSSFASVQKQAKLNGHRIAHWTLVVPAILHPAEMKWYMTWAAGQQRTTHTRVEIWQGDELRRQLMSAETIDVRREYFSHTLAPDAPAFDESPPVSTTDDYSVFENALFVRQLLAAQHAETSAAQGMFFATDALRRDLEARGSEPGLSALRSVQLSVHNAWEMHFNELVGACSADGVMPALYRAVLSDASLVPDAPGLRLQPAHKQGAAHMLVEEGRAGWVRHWRAIAAEHRAAPAAAMDDSAVTSGIEAADDQAHAAEADAAKISAGRSTSE